MNNKDTFDLIVIGSGPGGYVAAVKSAQLGMRTAVIEKAELGGVCLNWGCIPTKALLKSAQVYNYTKHLNDYGIDFCNADGAITDTVSTKPDIKKIVAREREISATMSKGIEFLFKKNNITLLAGTAELENKNTIKVTPNNSDEESYYVGASNIIIATGSKPNSLPFAPIDGKKIISYREALVPDSIPTSLAVIGSGAIGSELAYFYRSMGTEVHIIEYMDQLVPIEDADVAAQLSRSFRKMGIKVMTSANVKNVDTSGDNCVLTIETKKGMEEITVEKVLSAVGVKANIVGLGLEKVGVNVERGKILVDEYYKTNVDNIYAIGDVIPTPALAHVASAEGIAAVEKIAGLEVEPIDYSNIPGATYTSPEIASVGMNEKKVKEAGIAYKVGKFQFMASGKAATAGEREGFIKLIFDEKTDKLLGAHLIGANVTEMLSELVLAKKLGATSKQIAKTIHPHPTMNEGIMEAASEV
jgi:dihydrolipoamide dehydrogenase